jgi:predicted regulator of Ras-like GTPase activity (Roadblock/LC7/MglB family)
MSRLQESLRCFLAVEGVRTAALIDIATGMIVRSVGKPDSDLGATAACVADEARAARSALGADSPADDLVEITTVTGSRLHVSRVLRRSPSEGLLLFVDLERGKSNLGLASLRVSQLAPAVLA